jgi:ribosomal protein RSM22 (predicted rRNA methylase)
VAEISHSCYSAIVFAMEIQAKGEDGEIRSAVRLNPSQFEFVDWNVFSFYLFMICEDESVAKQVQKLEMPDDKYERLVGRPRQEKAKVIKDKNFNFQTEEEKNLNNITLDAGDRLETMNGGMPLIGFDQKETKA